MTTNIQEESVKSLLLRMYYNDKFLASGTGFTVKTTDGYALITCRHNFTGRDAYTDELLSKHGGIPNKVEIIHNAKGKLGKWIPIKQELYDDPEGMKEPLWYEHSAHGKHVDAIALPLQLDDNIACYPYSFSNKNEIAIGPADIINVIGFPFGKTAGRYFAIWATGFIASEPDFPYEDMSKFLIDCRSRQGQSGSPVVAYRNGGAIRMKSGSIDITGASITNLLGIYSGRINAESDLGVVWKTSILAEILTALK